MKLLEKLQAQARDKLDRLKEIREMTPEEATDEIRAEMKTVMDELDDLRGQIEHEQSRQRAADLEGAFDQPADQAVTPPDPPASADDARSSQPRISDAHDREAARPFASFGEQMQAVYRAAAPGALVDKRLLEQRAASGMSEGVLSDGGFLVQKDFAQELLKKTHETGLLASKCRRIVISANSNGTKIPGIDETSRADGSRWGGVQAYWASEAAEKTASKPQFRQIELGLNKLIGLCYATDEMLADAPQLGSILSQAFPEEFGFKVDAAIIEGSGAGQPLGIKNSSALVTVAKEGGQSAATVVTENILKMWSRMWGRSRPSAVWLINQDLEPQLYTMSLSVGTGGAPVYMPANGLAGQPYSTLFGRPVIPIEQCETLGTKGDIYLADFSQYLLADKGGIDAQQSIHVRFIYDEATFRFVYRVDAEPIWVSPLTPFKGTNTQSPFVTLATRS